MISDNLYDLSYEKKKRIQNVINNQLVDDNIIKNIINYINFNRITSTKNSNGIFINLSTMEDGQVNNIYYKIFNNNNKSGYTYGINIHNDNNDDDVTIDKNVNKSSINNNDKNISLDMDIIYDSMIL
jgi:hypothetical protein